MIDKNSLIEHIERLRRERNAIILAHNYQRGEVQDISDFVGDSLELSQKAAVLDSDMDFQQDHTQDVNIFRSSPN